MKKHNNVENPGLVFGLAITAIVLATSTLSRRALQHGWEKTLHEPAPVQPDAPIGRALLWAAVAGLIIGVARTGATRGAGHLIRKWRGELPDELRQDKQSVD